MNVHRHSCSPRGCQFCLAPSPMLGGPGTHVDFFSAAISLFFIEKELVGHPPWMTTCIITTRGMPTLSGDFPEVRGGSGRRFAKKVVPRQNLPIYTVISPNCQGSKRSKLDPITILGFFAVCLFTVKPSYVCQPTHYFLVKL
jgi:hypothetical protein